MLPALLSSPLAVPSPQTPPTSLQASSSEDKGDCVFVANLHVRKCGGTTVRAMFERLASTTGVWNMSGTYCMSMYRHAADLANGAGKHWSETHCDEDIHKFNQGVQQLREAIGPKGCKVVSTLLLRDSVDQIASEWVYFNNEVAKKGTTDPLDWARHQPDNVLSWLLHDEGWLWSNGHGPRGIFDTPAKLNETITIANCDAAMADLKEQFNQIDLVGTMDSPEEFARWWLTLGDMAGFNTSAAPPVAVNKMTGPLQQQAKLSPEERKEVRELNQCTGRAHVEAARRMNKTLQERSIAAVGSGDAADATGGKSALNKRSATLATTPSAFEQRVQALVRSWGGVIPLLDEEPSAEHPLAASSAPAR